MFKRFTSALVAACMFASGDATLIKEMTREAGNPHEQLDLAKVYHIINFYDDSEVSQQFNQAYEQLAERWNTMVDEHPDQYATLEFLNIDVGKYPEMKMEAAGKHADVQVPYQLFTAKFFHRIFDIKRLNELTNAQVDQNIDAWVENGMDALKYHVRSPYQTFNDCTLLKNKIKNRNRDVIVYYGSMDNIQDHESPLNVFAQYDRFAVEQSHFEFLQGPTDCWMYETEYDQILAIYTKNTEGLQPFAYKEGEEQLTEFAMSNFWANTASVASSNMWDERGALSLMEHKVNTVVLFTKEGHANKEDGVTKYFLEEVKNHFASTNMIVEMPTNFMLAGIYENTGPQNVPTPASLASIKDSDLPVIKYFIPVHQQIEHYPGDVNNLDFQHLKTWTAVAAVKSDIKISTKQLKNEDLSQEEREPLEQNLQIMKQTYKQLKQELADLENQNQKVEDDSAKTEL